MMLNFRVFMLIIECRLNLLEIEMSTSLTRLIENTECDLWSSSYTNSYLKGKIGCWFPIIFKTATNAKLK